MIGTYPERVSTLERPHPNVPLRLVLAEDSVLLREGLVRLFAEAGFDTVAAYGDAETLLAEVERLRPDLAVLDVRMPKLDGYEVTRALRADEATRRMPIILLTAKVQDGDVQRGFDAGADDYVRKPFSPQELRARVQAILGRR